MTAGAEQVVGELPDDVFDPVVGEEAEGSGVSVAEVFAEYEQYLRLPGFGSLPKAVLVQATLSANDL